MRVGILTFHQAINYGAVLQVYALQKIIGKLGVDVQIINYRCESLEKKLRVIRKPYFKHLLLSLNFLRKKGNFIKFSNKYLKLSKALNKSELNSVVEKYDLIVTGSDQVWNPSIIAEDYSYLLDFVEGCKKASYAASFGVSKLKASLVEDFKKHLMDFKYISVREVQGATIVKDLFGVDVPVVLDPTLLLNKEEWEEISAPPRCTDGFILVYCFRKSDFLIKYAEKLSKETGLPIIIISSRMKYVYGKNSAYTAGPEEFIRLLLDAEYILTNSFHGTVFSINFNKKFVTDIEADNGKNTSSRVLNMLKILELEERIVCTFDLEKMYADINYDRVNMLLDKQKQESINYLETILQNGCE